MPDNTLVTQSGLIPGMLYEVQPRPCLAAPNLTNPFRARFLYLGRAEPYPFLSWDRQAEERLGIHEGDWNAAKAEIIAAAGPRGQWYEADNGQAKYKPIGRKIFDPPADETHPAVPGMKPFRLKLDFDGETLSVDYCDGSDVERAKVKDKADLQSKVKVHITTALSPEEPDPGDI